MIVTANPHLGSTILGAPVVLWDVLGAYASGGSYMATFDTNQTMRASASLAALATDTYDLDLATNTWDRVEVQATIVFTATTCRPCWLRAYRSTDAGTKFDKTPCCEHELKVDSTLETTESIVVESPYVHVSLSNLDPSSAVTATIKYAGRHFLT